MIGVRCKLAMMRFLVDVPGMRHERQKMICRKDRVEWMVMPHGWSGTALVLQ